MFHKYALKSAYSFMKGFECACASLRPLVSSAAMNCLFTPVITVKHDYKRLVCKAMPTIIIPIPEASLQRFAGCLSKLQETEDAIGEA